MFQSTKQLYIPSNPVPACISEEYRETQRGKGFQKTG